MALWGTRDTFSVTGTVTATQNSTAVVGSGTDFLTELQAGDALYITGVKYKITSITDGENLTIQPAYAGTTGSGKSCTGQDAPKYLTARDGTVQGQDAVYGVDQTEAQANDTDPGWVRVVSYTDMHGVARTKREVLVAASSFGSDREDVVYPDAVVTILTQPASATANTAVANGAIAFTVSAEVDPDTATLVYRWEENQGAGFSELSNGGVYANVSTATLNIANTVGLDGYIYRVQISATGVTANTVSSNATLTVI